MWQLMLAVALTTLLLAVPISAEVTRAPFGKTREGTAVEQFTLKNKNGMVVKLMTRGATITEISVPDKSGKFANVALGFDDLAGYESDKNQYFGCTTGRVANRIAKGMFKLDGKDYKLAINNGPNHIHGGAKRSLDKVIWEGTPVRSRPSTTGQPAAENYEGVRFSYTSPDGEEGFPGTLKISVTFTLDDRNELKIAYDATTDKATPVNLTNHTYFNLAGAGADTALDHVLTIPSQEFTPSDDAQIPTGKVASVKGTVFDFTTPTRVGERIEKLYDTGAKGYDLYYVLKPSKEPALAARLSDPTSGRVLTVLTTEPGVQFYTGNFLTAKTGKDGKTYKQRSAICLETMGYPDAVNQPSFPSIIVRPEDTYRQICIYKFSVE
jgi:aldose 1-epimerase